MKYEGYVCAALGSRADCEEVRRAKVDARKQPVREV